MTKTEAIQILEIQENASEYEIEHAYRILAVKYHPDKCIDKIKCREKFINVNIAKDILLNPDTEYNVKSYKEYEDYVDRFYKDWII